MAVTNIRPLNKLSAAEINQFRMLRWKARTDLGFLCREILNYPDVSDDIHGPILNILQKFPVPTEIQFSENDKIVGGKWVYTPIQRHTSLPGGRKVLILDPRGWLKTTINAQSHTIQWLLNYPDISIMIVQSNLDKAIQIVGEIKRHFQYNPIFRQLFPEHCPVRSIENFGTMAAFTTPARGRAVTRKEESVFASSITAGSSGIHVDVIKYSDIVEPSNVGTEDQIAKVIAGFYMSQNLLVGPKYWIDVEGTRYSNADAYGEIIELDEKTPVEKKDWKIHARGCYRKDTGGKPQTYQPSELLLPDLIVDGKKVLHWNDPERGLTLDHYEMKRLEDPFIFSAQQLNCPSGGIDGRDVFPIGDIEINGKITKYPTLISRKNFTQNVRVSHYIATIDTAETTGTRSNYTCITIAAIASDGRVYINEIIHGKFLPNETVALICSLNKSDREPFRYGTKLQTINIEETAFVRGLMVSLNNYQQISGNYIPLNMIKRDNQIAKVERIQNTLQPYYMNKKLVFLDDLKPWKEVEKELRTFPLGKTDDILDTLADIFQDRTWFGRETARPTYTQLQEDAMNKFLGISDLEEETSTSNMAHQYKLTGGL